SAAYKTLNLASFVSSNGTVLTKQPDGSLLASGARPEKDTYVITADTDETQTTAVRLDVLTDDALPHKGPGRQDNGNLHLSEFRVTAAPASDPSAARPLTLKRPVADFDQQGWTAAMAIDGNPATAWGIYPEVGKPHQAVFE